MYNCNITETIILSPTPYYMYVQIKMTNLLPVVDPPQIYCYAKYDVQLQSFVNIHMYGNKT